MMILMGAIEVTRHGSLLVDMGDGRVMEYGAEDAVQLAEAILRARDARLLEERLATEAASLDPAVWELRSLDALLRPCLVCGAAPGYRCVRDGGVPVDAAVHLGRKN